MGPWRHALLCAIVCLLVVNTEASVAKRFLQKLQTGAQVVERAVIGDAPKQNATQTAANAKGTPPKPATPAKKEQAKPVVPKQDAPKKKDPKAPTAPTPASPPAYDIEKTPVPITKKEAIKMKKADLGAVTFFESFDADKDGQWSENEFFDAMRESKRRRYLPANFDMKAQWASMPKSVEGKVNMKDFITWSAKTPAHSPPKPKPKPAKMPKAKAATDGPKHCVEAFEKFDANHDGMMDHDEFVKAVQGKMSADGIEDQWADIRRTGPKGTLQLREWNDVCAAMTGLPKGPRAELAPDPCNPNPCHEAGTVCVRDPKKCATAPCPQFKCVRPGVQTSGQFRSYQQCKKLFGALDENRDNFLSEREFKEGLIKAAAGTDALIRPTKVEATWVHLQKNTKSLVDRYEFVHWCIAVKDNGGGNGGVVKEECWDVFKHFDKDSSSDLSSDEFSAGMQRGKKQGHIPVSLDIQKVFGALPKNSKSNVPEGPFVVWCQYVSKGVDPVKAAAATIKPLPAEPGQAGPAGWLAPGENATKNGTSVNGTNTTSGNSTNSTSSTGGSSSGSGGNVTGSQSFLNANGNKTNTTNSSNNSSNSGSKPVNGIFPNGTYVGPPALTPQMMANSIDYCKKTFAKANVDSSKQSKFLVMDEWHAVCEDVTTIQRCKNYTTILVQWDTDKDGQLSQHEFVSGCKTQGVAVMKANNIIQNKTKPKPPPATNSTGNKTSTNTTTSSGNQTASNGTTNASSIRFQEIYALDKDVAASGATSEEALQNMAVAEQLAVPGLPGISEADRHDLPEEVFADLDADLAIGDDSDELGFLQLALDADNYDEEDKEADHDSFLSLSMDLDNAVSLRL